MRNSVLLLIILLLTMASTCSKKSSSPSDQTGKSGSLARFAIQGNYLYTVDESSLKVFSIADPAAPVYIGESGNLVQIETIFIRDANTLFLGSTSGMYIYSLANPLAPEFISFFSHAQSCDPVVADSAYAYVTLRQETSCARGINQFDVIDIKNLESPSLVTSYSMKRPKGLALDNSLLIICDDSLKLYDRSLSPSIQHLISFPVQGNDIIANNGHYIITADDGIYQYQYNGSTLTYLSKLNN